MRKILFDEFQKLVERAGDKGIVIWGASVKGRCLLTWLKRINATDKVLFFVDSNEKIHGKKIDGYEIKAPKELVNKDNIIVFIASAAKDAIIKEIAKISTALQYEDMCKFCVTSKVDELFNTFLKGEKYSIVGNHQDYAKQIAYLKVYGVDICDVCAPNEASVGQGYVYLIVDEKHLEVEHELLARGLRVNRDYVVITDIFYSDYVYTKDGKDIPVFDRGSLGNKHLEDYFCPLPFTQLYYYDFRADICSPTWNNDINVGNPQENTIEEIWNSEKAQEIRRSILDGSFTYCNEEICWRLLEGKLFKKDQVTDKKLRHIIDNNITCIEGGPEFLNVGYNATCNLHCRMCRDGVVYVDQCVKDKAIKNLRDYDFANLKRLIIPGNGELFANEDYLDILLHIDEYSFDNLEAIWIYSNGVLFDEENWNKIAFLGERYKLKIFISTDSVCRETFVKIRRGGNYEKFMTNVRMLSKKRKEGRFDKLYLPFCVQRENFREMEEFVHFAYDLGADCVHFEKLFNSKISECVHRPENVYYEDFIDCLKKAVETGKNLGIEVETKPFMNILSGGQHEIFNMG